MTQNQSISAERERMFSVFAELRAAKFSFPSGWIVDQNVAGITLDSSEQDPAPNVEARPHRTSCNVQETADTTVEADRPTQQSYRSDAEILGIDLFGKPAAAPVYRKIQLANYAGPAFRAAMAVVDAAFNSPLLLTADNEVVDPTAVLRQSPSTPEVHWQLTVLVGRDDYPERRR